MEQQFLTVSEAAIKFKLTEKVVRFMLKDGRLTGFKVRTGEWRIVDPGPIFQKYLDELPEHLVHVPLLSSREAAAVLGITHVNLRQFVFHGKLKPAQKVKGKNWIQRNMFTVGELRRFLWKKEKRDRRGTRQVMIAQLIRWAKDLLDKERAQTAAPIVAEDKLYLEIQEIMKLPELQRIQSLRELWEKLDVVAHIRSVAAPLSPSSAPNHEQQPESPVQGETALD